ncbi:hypothetical protein MANES_01G090500v8 [Manihot esculenta]|uniref:Uncharacterized protein n=1 Tax=Manihot esculenta TaxID=3983 RepID=A0ACB7IBR6_MANES|nr:hypothetical protein MANES_01G090500v8 [Manihot esculenta]
MGTHEDFLHNSRFRLLSMGYVYGFLHQKLILFAHSFWFSVSALFGSFNRAIFRMKGNDSKQTNNSNRLELNSEQQAEAKGPEFESNCMEQAAKEPEVDLNEFRGTKENADSEEEETPRFLFKFRFQSYRENYEPVVSDFISSSSTNKYEFLPGKDSSLYLEKPDVFSVTVKELYADSIDGSIGDGENFEEQKSEAESIHEKRKENSAESAHKEEVIEKLQAEKRVEGSISAKGLAVDAEKEHNVWCDQHVSGDDGQFLSEKDFIDPDSHSDSDSITSSHEIISRFVASTSEGFLSDKDFEDAFELDIFGDIEGENAELAEEDLENINLQNLSAGYEADDFEDEDGDILEGLKNLQESNMQNSDSLEPEKLSDKKDVEELAELGCNDKESSDNCEDSNGLETLWEHQELIEQLKMELKKVKATGLPTILEEDESPKIMEDLKPWKIDEKFQRQDRMGELHKFYKSYRERMRKFDILNYQKMYALEDSIKDVKTRRKAKDDEAITSDTLVEIMEESIRIFWRFVRADKDANSVILKSRRGTQIEPLDPAELELLTEVRTSLQKKEKKLKDILRSGNCILRKFRKHKEDGCSDQVLYFFSQVDMKLVSRVLNMSKITTDQLIWCRNKLNKINFVSRKIHVEPSFLLFPC